MRDWHSYSIRDLVGSPISGSRPVGGVSEDTEGVPSLGGENIRAEGGVSYESVKKISREFFCYMPKGRLQGKDVLINKDGAQTGKVGIYDGRYAEAAVNEHLFILRSSNGRIDQALLYYYLLSSNTQKDIARRITGSAQPGLNSQFVDAVCLSIPVDSMEQRRVAEILSTIDDAIAHTEALIAKTQAIKAGLMHDLFTRGITPDGRLRPTREEAPKLYKQSPLGWIPRAWRFDYLAHLTTKIVDGVHHTPEYVESGVPFVTVSNLTRSGGIDFSAINYITASDHQEFLKRADPREGDVLVTKDGTLGVSRIVEKLYPEFSIFVSVALLRPNTSLLRPKILHLFFESGTYLKQLGKLSAGTGLKHIHLEHFRRFAIPLPSVDDGEQDRIASSIDMVDSRLSEEESYLQELLYLKTGLLHDLLSGRVRVPLPAAASAQATAA